MSANTVQILSNPNIIVALEQFQGKRKEQDEVQLLSNPKVLAALKEFHAKIEWGNFPAPENVVVVSNEEEDMFSESVLQNMKQEGKPSSKPAKRKLTEYDKFSKVWTTPKCRKKASEKEFAFSAGSPHRGKWQHVMLRLMNLKKWWTSKLTGSEKRIKFWQDPRIPSQKAFSHR